MERQISIACPDITQLEVNSVIEVLKSGNLSSGDMVKKFEKRFADYIGVKHAIAVNSGTAALHCAYLASGMKASVVRTTPLTFNATINMLMVEHNAIKFTDIRDDFNIDSSELDYAKVAYVENYIVPVHLYGLPCKMDEICEFAEKNGSGIVEDCAQSCGASFKGHKVGSWGDIGCFSFYGSKILTTAEGGMCVTDNAEIAEKIRDLRHHSLNQGGVGYNYRMTDISAAIGIEQLKRIDKFIEKRRKIAKIYNEEFEGLIKKLPTEKEHIYNSYSFCIPKRDKFIVDMNRLAIDCRVYYPKPFADLPNVSRICKEVVSIPIRPNLNNDELNYIIDSVKKCLK